MPWQSSADQSEKKHTDIFSRAREGEAACERDTGNKNHTVVLEVVPRTTTTHSGVEGLSGPCRGRVPKTEDSPQGQCNRWSPRSGKQPQSVTGGRERERATDRKAVFSNSVAVLSLIERVMSNLTGEVVLQDNAPHTQRAEGV